LLQYVYGLTEENGALPYPNNEFFPNNPDPFDPINQSNTIKNRAWDITWLELADGDALPSGVTTNDVYPPSRGGQKLAFLNLDCNLYPGRNKVVIDNLNITNLMFDINAAFPHRTLSIANCESVSIKNSSFKGPVSQQHIQITNTKHIYIDNIEIAGTDPDGNGKYCRCF
jgi:hypothetical protein